MSPSSSFRRSSNSRSRRRWLVLRAAAELEEEHARRLARAANEATPQDSPPATRQDSDELVAGDQLGIQVTESVGAAVPELVGKPAANDLDPVPATDNTTGPETLFPGEDEVSEPDELAAIRELVAGPRPATWVFCGNDQAETSFPDQFAVELRTTYRRPLDVVVNTLVPGSPMESVLENLEWQLARFHPDVVNLLIGPAAGSTGSGFVATMTQLVNQLQELGTAVVIHTPAPDGSDELQAHVDQVRNFATERTLPLVEHAAADGDQERVDRLCQALRLQRPGS